MTVRQIPPQNKPGRKVFTIESNLPPGELKRKLKQIYKKLKQKRK